jgi:hypothetical protein
VGQDEKALIGLWQEKRGEVGPKDLSANLIVQLGVATEDLNRVWYERTPGYSGTSDIIVNNINKLDQSSSSQSSQSDLLGSVWEDCAGTGVW